MTHDSPSINDLDDDQLRAILAEVRKARPAVATLANEVRDEALRLAGLPLVTVKVQ